MESNQNWRSTLSYAQTQRMVFFEAKLQWEGRVNREDVCKQFGVTKNHFTRDLREYRENFPSNIEYDVSSRAYRTRDTFQPQFSNGTASEYLSLLRSYSLNAREGIMSEIGSVVSCSLLPEPNGNVKVSILKALLRSIHESHCLVITYQSFSSNRAKNRKIWPHSLAWAGQRWHVRAFDHDRNQHIDLALVRILSAKPSNDLAPADSLIDSDWEETIKVSVTPNPLLSSSQRKVVANEYGMKKKGSNYVWVATVKKCMVGYFLQKYRLDRHDHDSASNRLVLVDPTISEKYSFRVLA